MKLPIISFRVGFGVLPAQEVVMKKLLAIAALLLASSAAQAQYTFEYGGRTIRVDPDRGTVSIPGVYDNTGQQGQTLAQRRCRRDRPPRKQRRRGQDRPAIRRPHPRLRLR